MDSDDQLSLLTQEDKNQNVNEVPIDMENLMDSSLDSAVGSLASVGGDTSDSEPEIIYTAQCYKSMVEDISDGEE